MSAPDAPVQPSANITAPVQGFGPTLPGSSTGLGSLPAYSGNYGPTIGGATTGLGSLPPSSMPSSNNSGTNLSQVLGGLGQAAGLANTGLGIFSALTQPGPHSANILTGSNPASLSPAGGNGRASSGGNQITMPGAYQKLQAAGGIPGQGSEPGSKHFETMLQLLKVPRG